MKKLNLFIVAGLFACAVGSTASAALTQKTTLLGKFLVSSVKGDVTAVADGRILEIKKGDTLQARGTVLRTAAGAHATIVFSNGTGLYTDEKTNFEIVKFDQEFFAPNNNLRVEPSNSSTIVKLNTGRVVISTPRLVSGTTMVYQTPHAAVGVRGEKILVECSEQQSHVAVIEGLATVNVRDRDGEFVSIGKRLTTGKEAFVKRVISGSENEEVATIEETADDPSRDPEAPVAAALRTPPLEIVTRDIEAVALKVSGSVRVRLPGQAAEVAVTQGAKFTKGAMIFTDANSELQLQPFTGAVATFKPQSTVQIESLTLSTRGDTIKRQSAMLALKNGVIVSTIDPAKRSINDYSIRTPKGVATAKGTSFTVAVDGETFSVTSTADTVSFLVPDGTEYQISAGMVSISPPGGRPEVPVSLAAALSGNPNLKAIIEGAFGAVVDLVQNNTGALSAESATNLLVKVAHTAALALPDQAASFTTAAVTAVSASTSATANSTAAAIAAVTQAIASAAPTQAPQIASAAAMIAPAHSVGIAAAAAKESPTLAPQIAQAVASLSIATDTDGLVSAASVQTAAAISAAVVTAVPDRASSVAAAVLEALMQAAPNTPPLGNAINAATIAAATTTAAPTQAAPIASAMMKSLTQTNTFADASAELIGQTAGIVASAVTSVVPEQAQPVATAVMQLLIEADPTATPAAIAEISGILTASVVQTAPDQADAVFAGVAAVSGQTVVALQASVAQFEAIASSISQQLVQINQAAASATEQSIDATLSLAAGVLLAHDRGAGASSNAAVAEPNSATSIIITQFDPSTINDLLAGLDAAQAAQSEVQFDTTSDGNGGTTVVPVFTTPAEIPRDFVRSVSRVTN